jgi:hypothetical protein
MVTLDVVHMTAKVVKEVYSLRCLHDIENSCGAYSTSHFAEYTSTEISKTKYSTFFLIFFSRLLEH